ncbi:SAM-dependent methyltransferase [Actinokineospora sp. UTMC 2448]|uniref:SAM-dependent methyltransferase n=1 Tax=Actinokineospora sp. UTMC 2448 TaxID=2268449 RepID=UPI00216460A0|nr:SAM-dependent methyltransferase [Actinokineospora sp. UTMC 2448]UVS81651.1 S-adenosyl methyltransferase [Actinokineospora sp. UTMC 2448]
MGTPDTDQPHPARIYDYLLGGAFNFAADRAFAEQIIATMPGAPLAARINRDFLRRAVQAAVADGVDQFLDLGSGIPTVGNTHEVAPAARVVYVDHDAIAVAHSRDVLAGHPDATIVAADIRDADTVLTAARELIDFSRPVAVLAVAVLHFVPDAEATLAPYRAAIGPGSLIAISHATHDAEPGVEQARRMYESRGIPGFARTKAEVTALLDGLTLLPPGVVWTSRWRPEADDDIEPTASLAYAAVGRVP